MRGYEGNLAMLSQELERINAVIDQKNAMIEQKNFQIRELESQAIISQKSVNKESRDTMEILSAEIGRLNGILCESLEQVSQQKL
jgi:hypothetical protein